MVVSLYWNSKYFFGTGSYFNIVYMAIKPILDFMGLFVSVFI